MVWRSSAGTEYMSVNSGGDFILESSLAGGGSRITWDNSASTLIFRRSTDDNFAKLRLAIFTTSPTTGLIKGDMFLAQGSASLTGLRLGVCVSTATQLVSYGRKFDLAFGSQS